MCSIPEVCQGNHCKNDVSRELNRVGSLYTKGSLLLNEFAKVDYTHKPLRSCYLMCSRGLDTQNILKDYSMDLERRNVFRESAIKGTRLELDKAA